MKTILYWFISYIFGSLKANAKIMANFFCERKLQYTFKEKYTLKCERKLQYTLYHVQ